MGSSSIQSQDQPHWVGRVDFLKLSSKLETLRGESGAINIYTKTVSINEDVCSTPEWLKYELKKKGCILEPERLAKSLHYFPLLPRGQCGAPQYWGTERRGLGQEL